MLNSFDKTAQQKPFAYFSVEQALLNKSSLSILNWLETSAPWKLKIADFYEQYEFNFLDAELPLEIAEIFNKDALQTLTQQLEQSFKVTLSNHIDITAHKLVSGQTIRLHNDYIQGQETHRVLIQLNRGWEESKGGLLFFFNSDNPRDIHRVFLPIHNTSVAFEISPTSFHAVSTITSGDRYTLVLSFFSSDYRE